MILKFWMSQTTPVMALMLTAAMAAFALFLCWLSFAPRFAGCAQYWKGVTPPFVAVPATLFGLLMTFLSQDVWEANRSAYRAIALEREQLAMLSALSNNGSNADGIPHAVHDYIEAVVGLEWKTMEDGKEAPEAEAALNRLTRVVASAKIEPVFQRTLINTVMRLRSAREQRLAVAGGFPDDRKWAAVILIAFITQIALAVVHLDRPSSQLLAQAIFALAAIVPISLVASVDEPYSPPNAVSSEPLAQLLERYPQK
ncbi:MAG: hypothetical protein AB7F41_11370 [Methylocystis sp.]|uniref:bestrophin-like domain n=1 Tax=Methylocystis sp. TaxID=1911079 RepID=UPI003D1463D4